MIRRGAKAPQNGPKAGEILATQAAAVLRLTPQSLTAWTNRPDCPSRRVGTRVYVQDPAFFRWRESELIRQAKAEVAPAALEAARTRKALAEAELAEFDVGKIRGELVTVQDYETALARVLDLLMARMRAMPVRLSHLGPEMELAIEKEIERMVEEMNGFDEDVLSDDPSSCAARGELATAGSS